MKTVTVRCNLCGHDDWFVRFPATLTDGEVPDVRAFRCTSTGYGEHPQIVQCRYCGYVYANPRWVDADLLDAYQAVEDEVYVRERQGRELTFRKHLESLHRVTGPPQGRRLLDVGAYIGVFVEVARDAGWQACGVEPSRWAVDVARSRDLPVIQGTQQSFEPEKGKFDVITMWDVIEHLADPAADLARSFELLKPGGIIAVHTMDVESVAARLLGQRWPWLMDMHVHYFSRRTMKQMLHKTGFELIWCGAQSRYLRLGYLASRLQALSPAVGKGAVWLVEQTGLNQLPIPVSFGDLFTTYARRPIVR